MRSMRAALFSLLLAGCYSPSLSNPGFYCHAEDNPACPDGQSCINGRCVGEGVTVPTSDGGGDVGVGGGPTGPDLSTGGPGDMAKPHDLSQAPTDFSQPPDLAQPTCGQSNASCNKSSDCCSGVCFISFCF